MTTNPPAMGRLRRGALRAVLLLLPVVAVGCLEGVARLVYHVRHGVPGHRYGTSKSDPVFGAMPREHSYNSNSQLNDMGFRNTENVFEPKPPGSLRLIAYGGSTTYCHDLANDDAWPIRLQERLRNRGGPATHDQVLNGGVIMWSLGHIFEKARRDVPRLKPDYVLIYSGLNENYNAMLLQQEGVSMRALVEAGEYGRFATNLAFNTPLRDFLTYKALRTYVYGRMETWRASRRPPAPAVTDPFVMRNYLETLRRLMTFLRSHGVQPIFVKEIHRQDDTTRTNKGALAAYSADGAAHAPGWGAIVIDPSAMLAAHEPGDPALFQATGVHFTELGAQRFADILYEVAFARLPR